MSFIQRGFRFATSEQRTSVTFLSGRNVQYVKVRMENGESE